MLSSTRIKSVHFCLISMYSIVKRIKAPGRLLMLTYHKKFYLLGLWRVWENTVEHKNIEVVCEYVGVYRYVCLRLTFSSCYEYILENSTF